MVLSDMMTETTTLSKVLSRKATPMGLFASAAKLGLAKKGIDALRKPENQRKLKDAAASIKAKRSKGTAT